MTTDEREVLILKAARILSNSAASVCGVDKDDNWAIYSEVFIADARAIFDELFPLPICNCTSGAAEWSGSPSEHDPDNVWTCDDCGKHHDAKEKSNGNGSTT